jgi:RNA polymerase sigma-70 factor (ECF subfamily)
LRTWPERGVPERPDSWLVTAARRNLVDAARRRDTASRALPEIARAMDERAQRDPAGPVPDDRLRLMFACAHPAVAPAVRSPLILQAVLGLDAARISEAFLVAPATMGQRLVRAKAKIKDARIPFRVPDADELASRLDAVLDAVYAAYGTGWDDVDGLDPGRAHLVEEAIRLARLLVELLPEEPECLGLLALLLHSSARTDARRTADGRYVPLGSQDVGRWSRPAIEEAEQVLAAALALGGPGPYQLQAAIQSVHNLRAATGRTDWQAISRLYDGLVRLAPSVGALVARAAAHREVHGPEVALDLLRELPDASVAGYQPYWVLRAHCERDLQIATAADSAARAIGLTASPYVAAHLREVFPDV